MLNNSQQGILMKLNKPKSFLKFKLDNFIEVFVHVANVYCFIKCILLIKLINRNI